MLRFLLTLVLWTSQGCPGAERFTDDAPKAHNRADGGCHAEP